MTAIIIPHIVARQSDEQVLISNDRMTVRMFNVNILKSELAEFPVGIIFSHAHFPQYDLAFFLDLFGSDGRIHQHIGEDIQGHVKGLRGNLDRIDRVVLARRSVDLSADSMDLGGNGAHASLGRSFKKHMFEKMRNTAAQIIAFGRGTRFDQGIHTDDRAGRHFPDQNRQAVIKDLFFDGLGVYVGGKEKTRCQDKKTDKSPAHNFSEKMITLVFCDIHRAVCGYRH